MVVHDMFVCKKNKEKMSQKSMESHSQHVKEQTSVGSALENSQTTREGLKVHSEFLLGQISEKRDHKHQQRDDDTWTGQRQKRD